MSDKDGAKRGAGPYSRNYLTGAKFQEGPIRKYLSSPAEQAAKWPKVTKHIDKEEGRKGFKDSGVDAGKRKKDWA